MRALRALAPSEAPNLERSRGEAGGDVLLRLFSPDCACDFPPDWALFLSLHEIGLDMMVRDYFAWDEEEVWPIDPLIFSVDHLDRHFEPIGVVLSVAIEVWKVGDGP